MTEESEAKPACADTADRCPCCKAEVEYFPDQDGSCDYQCLHCGWSEHVPGSGDIAAALTLHGDENAAVRPTVIVWVKGGLVQGVEADAPARVLVCDFDCEEEDAPQIDGRACALSEWDPPEKPSEEFGKVLEVVGSEDRDVPTEG